MPISQEQVDKIKKYLDEHNGVITKDAFIKGMHEHHGVDNKLAEGIFNRIDKNHTGQISGEQLKEVAQKVQHISNVTEEQRTKIREGVLEYLNTHDGKISKDAFVKGASEKHGVPQDIADLMFENIDQGNKGYLDIEDLKAVAARAQARH